MAFNKFPKVKNTSNKEMDRVFKQYPKLAKETWVAQEKLDGANIQIEFDGSDFSVFKRSGPADHTFYNYYEAIDLQGTAIKELFGEVASELECGVSEITLCGELFGDGVQKRIRYGPKRFAFFDIKVNGDFVIHPMSLRTSDLFVKYLSVGTFDELYDGIGSNVETLQSQYSEAGDYAEGIVLKPQERYVDNGNDTLIQFKIKRSAFNDAKVNPKRKEPTAPSQQAEDVKQKVLSMVNENRLADLFSKHGEIEGEWQIGQYIKLFNEDIVEELEEDIAALDKKERKYAMNTGSEIAKLLKTHL